MEYKIDITELEYHWSTLEKFLEGWSERQGEIVRQISATHEDVHVAKCVCDDPHVSTEVDIDAKVTPKEIKSEEIHEYFKDLQPHAQELNGDFTESGKEFGFQDKDSGSQSLQRRPTDLSLIGFQRKHQKGFRRGLVQSVVTHKIFESTCAVVIMANAVTIGVAADYNMSHIGQASPTSIVAAELAFTCFYTFEIGMRLFVSGWEYFRDEDKWKWNVFDVILVAQGIWDQFQSFVLDSSGGALSNLSFLRLLRLTKMLKLLRMIRLMRSFKELRLILSSIMGCAKSVMWSASLIVSVSYMFGIAFLQGCITYLESNPDGDEDTARDIEKYWSSIGQAMVTLFVGAMGGLNWQYQVECFYEVGWVFYALYLVYISLFVFVISNTISSVFLEAMMSHADKDHQLIVEMQLEKKHDYIDKIQVFFDEIDDDGDGEITYDEFCHNMYSPHMYAFAGSLDIDIADTKQFFHIMSDQGRRQVDIETFVVGCIKLRGAAKSMDLMDLVYTHKDSTTKILSAIEKADRRLESIYGKILSRTPVQDKQISQLEMVDISDSTVCEM